MDNKKTTILITIICVMVALSLIPYFQGFFSKVQTVTAPSPTPFPAFTLVLNGTVNLNEQETQFQVTLTKNSDQDLKFPCTLEFHASSNWTGSATNPPFVSQTINDYGTYPFSFGSMINNIYQ